MWEKGFCPMLPMTCHTSGAIRARQRIVPRTAHWMPPIRRSAQLMDVNESAAYGIRGSNSWGLRGPPREFPLYIVWRIPHSSLKYTQSGISSSACKTALYSDIPVLVITDENPLQYCEGSLILWIYDVRIRQELNKLTNDELGELADLELEVWLWVLWSL